jgi:hypothetical protein
MGTARPVLIGTNARVERVNSGTTQIRFERVGLSNDRGVRHGSPARGGREAAKAADFNEDHEILREPRVFHLCILCTVGIFA